MKIFFLVVITIFLSVGIWAQPDSEIFPDFTYTDLDGVTHNLQSYLDEGKTVVIDVFATWCPNCQQSVPGWESLYNQHGQGGDQTFVLLSFERDANTTNELEYIEEYGVESPVITDAEDVIDELWNITYQPRYFVICPDGTFESELSSPIYSNPQPLIDMAENCEEVVGIDEVNVLEFEISGTQNGSILMYQSNVVIENYRIFNLLGSLVQTESLRNEEGQINISSLESGIYLLNVTSENSSSTLRFVKQ